MAQLTTLSSADIQRFERDGYLMVRQAFSCADSLAMERRWWRELEDTHGIRRDDRSSWRQIRGDLKAAKRDPVQARILAGRVRGVLDDLLGNDAWSRNVPARGWHWDNLVLAGSRLAHPAALFAVSFIGPVAPAGGGTVILSGSPRLLIQQGRTPASQQGELGAGVWNRFGRSDPWLAALTGQAPSPADRIAAFMTTESIVDGVRVVELTGEPGDMVFCHPAMVHCASPNRGQRPRFMRIRQQLATREGHDPFSTPEVRQWAHGCSGHH